MTLGEGTIIDGSGVQTTTNSRWGDYTDMTVDPRRRLHVLVRERVLPDVGNSADPAMADPYCELQAAGVLIR